MRTAIMHGMAGSAALFLLALQGVTSFASGLAYIALFGLGSILGMAALSLVFAVPLRLSARPFALVHCGLEAVVGLATVAIGARVLWVLWW